MLVFKPEWSPPAWVRSLSTTRQAGNFFLAPVRQRLQSNLGRPIAWLTQCHGREVIPATPEIGCIADASFTTHTEVICAIRTADCLPILLAAQKTPWVAAVHAGWQGLWHNIIEAAVEKAPRGEPLLAWIGPSISRQVYVVDQAFQANFLNRYPMLTHAFLYHQDKIYCDLKAIAIHQLHTVGIINVSVSPYCTYRDANLLDSYRRQGDQSGRQATLIWIQP